MEACTGRTVTSHGAPNVLQHARHSSCHVARPSPRCDRQRTHDSDHQSIRVLRCTTHASGRDAWSKGFNRESKCRSSTRTDSSTDTAVPAGLRSVRKTQLGFALLVSGAVSGTLLDGIHSRVGLQIYQLFAVNLGLGPAGILHTSYAVPPLLGIFYLVLGALFVLADDFNAESPATDAALERSRNPRVLALSVGCLAACLHLSAVLYSTGVPFPTISAVLAVASVGMLWTFDRTVQGVILAIVCALGAPAAEVVLLHFVPLWSYPSADVAGFVSWVPWCYCFYTPVLAVWSRFLLQACQEDRNDSSLNP